MQHGTSLPGLEPGASGLEVQRAIPLRHRDYASTVKVWYIFPSISLRIASFCIPATSGPIRAGHHF